MLAVIWGENGGLNCNVQKLLWQWSLCISCIAECTFRKDKGKRLENSPLGKTSTVKRVQGIFSNKHASAISSSNQSIFTGDAADAGMALVDPCVFALLVRVLVLLPTRWEL